MRNWLKFMLTTAFIFPSISSAENSLDRNSNQGSANEIPKINSSAPGSIKDKEDTYAKWEKVFEDKTMQVYVDVHSIQWIDDRIGFWKMIDLNKKLDDGALSLWVSDTHLCGKKLLQRSSIIHFKGQFGSGKTISRDDNERDIERIKPGSMDDVVDDYVCKLKH